MLQGLIRTVVPWIVGLLLSWGVADFFEIDETSLLAIVTTVVSTLYYAVGRKLEQINPNLGWLLGLPTPPTYDVVVGEVLSDSGKEKRRTARRSKG